MAALPQPVLDYLATSVLAPRSPAYLCVRKNGTLIDWGGPLETYGLDEVQSGVAIEDLLGVLTGFFPLEATPLLLSYIKTDTGRSMDIHLIPGATSDWILLLDATQEEQRQILLQPKTNDLALLRNQQANQQADRGTLSHTEYSERLPTIQPQSSVLVAQLRNVQADTDTPETLFQLFHTWQRSVHRLLPVVHNAGGIIDTLQAGSLTAVFGLQPSVRSSTAQALSTAFCMLELSNQTHTASASSPLDLGIGIASGALIVGQLDVGREQLSLLGAPLQRAARLQRHARAGELLIDDSTFRAAEDDQKVFSACPSDRLPLGMTFSYLTMDNSATDNSD